MANYRQIEKILQSATPKQRATMIKQNGLDGAFDADGSLTAEKLRELGENVIDGQTDTQGENAQGEGISAAESVQFRFDDGKDQADNELVEFYQSVLSMANPKNASKRKQALGQVSHSHAALVSDVIKKETGKQMDVSDFEIVMDGSAVNHIEDRHGKNGKADHSMEDQANIARIPWAMNNATQAKIMRDKDGNFDLDTAYKNADGTSSYKVKLERPIGNDRFYVVECVPDSARKQLIVKSAYIEKGSRGQVVTREADGSPYPTSETFRADATNSSIPQNSDLSTASGEKSSGNFDHRFMSPDLWRRTAEVDADLKAISKRSGTPAKVFSDELSEGAKKNYRKTKKALNALNAAGGNGVSLVITEPSDTYKGGLVNGRTIYMPADQLESGDWAGTLVHEFTHFEEGTKEYSEMMEYLQSDDILVDDGKGGRAILRDVAEQAVQGKGYGFDAEALRTIVDKADAGERLTAEEAKALRAYTSEVTAHETEIMLGNEGFIDRIVRQNGSAAERLVGKLLSLDKAFSKMGDKQAKAQRDKIREAERLYLKAATAAGNGNIRKMILSQVPELEDEEVQLARKESKENQGLTIDNYTEEDYNNYGWVRANDVLTAGQMKNFEARFAKVKSKQLKTYKSKQGEYMIPVSDIYDYESEGIENVIVYAKGEIDSPIVTRILEIDLDNETDIDKERRKIYDAERRGIQPPSGNLFRFHHSTDYGYRQYGQGTGTENIGNNSESSVERGRGSKASARLKGFHVNENGSTTYYRADGSEEVKFSLKERADTVNQQTTDDFSDTTPSKRSKTKAEVLKDNARLREEKKKANERADERDDRVKLGERIGDKVQKLKGLRDGRMMAASEYKSDILRGSVERLAQITYSRTVTGSVRHIVKDLSEWYVQGNPLLVDENAYDEDIAIMMQEIALGEEGEELSFGEMRMLDNILGHMLKIDEKFNKVKKGNEYTDAKPYAEKYVRNMRDAKKNETGFVRLMRSRYLRTFGDPLSLVRAFDAYAAEGFWTETYQEFRQALVDMSIAEMDMMRDFEEFFKQNKGFEKHLLQSTVTYRGQELRFDEAASLYMTTKRKQAQRGLVESYYTVLDDKGNKHDAEGFAPRATGEGDQGVEDGEKAAQGREHQEGARVPQC